MNLLEPDANVLKSITTESPVLKRIASDTHVDEDAMHCHWCGGVVEKNIGEVLNHIQDDGSIDYDADGDHTPILELE